VRVCIHPGGVSDFRLESDLGLSRRGPLRLDSLREARESGRKKARVRTKERTPARRRGPSAHERLCLDGRAREDEHKQLDEAPDGRDPATHAQERRVVQRRQRVPDNGRADEPERHADGAVDDRRRECQARVPPRKVGSAEAPGEEKDGAKEDERVVEREAPDLLGTVQVLGLLGAEEVEAGPRGLDVAVRRAEPDVATRTGTSERERGASVGSAGRLRGRRGSASCRAYPALASSSALSSATSIVPVGRSSWLSPLLGHRRTGSSRRRGRREATTVAATQLRLWSHGSQPSMTRAQVRTQVAKRAEVSDGSTSKRRWLPPSEGRAARCAPGWVLCRVATV